MKKVLNNLFYFVVGGIICTSIGVYATITYQANQINYNNTTLDHVLDDLYTASNAENYTFDSNITPSNETQTFQTTGKRLTNNVVVNPIPSNYKDVSNATNFSASDLRSGAKAYNSSGELITGTASNCKSGTYVKPADSVFNLDLGFAPTMFLAKYTTVNEPISLMFLTYNNSDGKIYGIQINDSSTTASVQSQYSISGTRLISSHTSGGNTYKSSISVNYIACN